MKKHIVLIGYLLLINCVLIGQNLSEAEYFFDSDPGIGYGIPISMTEGDTVNFIFDTDVSDLSEGFHTLFVRFKNSSNIWSLYEGRTFYIQPEYEIEQTASIRQAEYFFDADPGIGNGTSISMTEGDTVNFIFDTDVSGLSEGFHTLFVRFKNDQEWSLYEGRTFYIQPEYDLEQTANIRQAEYFFDTDPGVGNGTSILITESDTINFIFDTDVSGLSEGFHTLFVRFKNDQEWSLYEGRTFYVQPETDTQKPATLVAMEYFIGDDPGVGNGTPLSVSQNDTINTEFDIVTTGINTGTYKLSIRVKDADGIWSIAEADTFKIVDCDFPEKPIVPIGSDVICVNDQNQEYYISEVPFAESYEWFLTPLSAGTVTGTDTIGTVDWDNDFTGIAELSVRGVNDCAFGPVSETLEINIYPLPVADVFPDTTICQGETLELIATGGSEYLWSTDETNDTINVLVDETTTYSVTVTENNCSATAEVEVIAIPVYNETDAVSICSGENYTFGTQTLTESGEYVEVFESVSGCDSTATLTLTVNPVYNEADAVSICSGESFTFGTQTLTESGAYTEIFESVTGCDSTVTLTLTVNPIYNETDAASICAGDSYSFGTQTLTSAGEYTEVFESVYGCDSTVVLILTINPVYEYLEDHEICEGEKYNWHGLDYTTTGTYQAEYTSVNGCDSIYELDLTVFDLPPTPIISQSGDTLQSDTEYGNQWYLNDSEIQGATNDFYVATSEGNYSDIVTDNNGCVSDTSNVITVTFTGINNLSEYEIKIYPNPAKEKLFIESTIDQPMIIEIFDVTGNLKKTTFQKSPKIEIDLQSLSPSIYFVRISIKGQHKTIRFIKN